MKKEKLLGIIRDLLKTDLGLEFLLKLEKEELEKLTACIRDRLEQKREEESLQL